jgi:hypothetical protein
VCQRGQLRALVPEGASATHPKLLQLTRDELMRHEAAGITTAPSPR